tara:strand:- start:78712 stop:79347 length:636 start_codon:yes stop_codon:yes gene_type:complete
LIRLLQPALLRVPCHRSQPAAGSSPYTGPGLLSWNHSFRFHFHQSLQTLVFRLFGGLAQNVPDLAFHIFIGLIDLFGRFQLFHNVITEGGGHGLAVFPGVQFECLRREVGIDGALLDPAQIATALGGNGIFGILLSHFRKIGTRLQFAVGLMGFVELGFFLVITHFRIGAQQDMGQMRFFFSKLVNVAVVIVLDGLLGYLLSEVCVEIATE